MFVAEMSKAIIIAYWRPQYGSGHYIAGISTNNDGVGGRFNFYNNEDGFFDCNDEKSVWQYVDALKKKGYIPLCIIGVNLKKGWW